MVLEHEIEGDMKSIPLWLYLQNFCVMDLIKENAFSDRKCLKSVLQLEGCKVANYAALHT